MKRLLIALGVLLFLSACSSSDAVLNKATAIRIAKADWYEKTGEEMDKDHPLEAFSRDGLWVVTVRLPLNTLGGGPTVEVDSKTGFNTISPNKALKWIAEKTGSRLAFRWTKA